MIFIDLDKAYLQRFIKVELKKIVSTKYTNVIRYIYIYIYDIVAANTRTILIASREFP